MAGTGTSTSNIYIHVIEDVINKVRDEFINDGGPGDDVLAELQGIWEFKMIHAGAIWGPIDRSAKQKAAGGPVTPNPVHDLNVPYEGTEEYETPTADMLFPPTPLQTPMQTPLPGTAQTPLPGTAPTPLPGNDSSPYFSIPTGGTPITPNEYSSNNDNGGEGQMRAGAGRPSPYMDFFLMPSGKRKREDVPPQYHSGGYIPQQDGAGDVSPEVLKVGPGSIAQIPVQEGSLPCRIPQSDGPIPDPYDDALSTPNMYNYQGVINEDYNIVNTPMPNEMQAATPLVPKEPVDDDDDDEPLNEDDDDELDDLEQGEDLNTTNDLVLAQFDKVTRTKSRWKCTLKNGIMRVNNKDILFNKATGEFDF
ncbi:transcription initiation factor IIA large subunit-like isoform X2 [Salvia splendens]|uniref:transcription initiation factor IIA large subunit-like isoform X2 n=1 Tax=Salvia splendens TaxID=180675 RepID=UPI001C25165E|nr:transcription initiation factor IIA large subunit-like isoform X2 [Salvia splendens]